MKNKEKKGLSKIILVNGALFAVLVVSIYLFIENLIGYTLASSLFSSFSKLDLIVFDLSRSRMYSITISVFLTCILLLIFNLFYKKGYKEKE